MKKLQSTIYHSPIGDILVAADKDTLCFLDFAENNERLRRLLTMRFGEYVLQEKSNVLDMKSRLKRYFRKDWTAFEGVKMDTGGTDFQRTVWKALGAIPVGETMSYNDLAVAINKPKAIRAAGSANGRNPIALIIPCHRVIGKDGTLRGYAGGFDRKAWLLSHENAL